MRTAFVKWIGAYVLACAAFLVPLAVFNWYMDPFQFFHRDDVFVIDNRYQRHMNAGLIMQADPFEVLVVGSSYVSNFSPSVIEEAFDKPGRVLSSYASSTREAGAGVDLAIRSHPMLDVVMLESSIWGVCNSEINQARGFPMEVYTGRPLGFVEYLLSWETADLSRRKMTADPAVYGRDEAAVYRWYERYRSYFDDPKRLARETMADKAPSPPKTLAPEAAKEQQERTLQCFEDNILSIARRHPEVEFLIFNPPIMQWLLWARDQYGVLDPWVAAMERIGVMVADIPNVRYFDFYAATEQVGSCEHWRDGGHFDLVVGDLMVRAMAQGRFERTPESNEAISEATREAITERVACS